MHKLNLVNYEELKILLFEIFVDDGFLALNQMKLGVRFDPELKLMVWSPKAYRKDSTAGRLIQHVTMSEFTKLCSSIIECMNFTFDIPQLNDNKCMPVLDIQVWMGQQYRTYGIPVELMHDRPVNSGKLPTLILYKFYIKKDCLAREYFSINSIK